MASRPRWPVRPYQRDRRRGAEYISAMLAIGGYLDERGTATDLCSVLPYCHAWTGKLPIYEAMKLDGYEQAELIEHLESVTEGM